MRIVIAEDEPKSREGLIRLIRRFTDYEIVGVAENGEEGYRLTEKEKPDLVLSDIKMPVLDGLGMLQKIKDAGIEVQAVLLTGYSEFEYARKALQLQVVEYVLKPMDIDQFLGVLKKVESRIVKQKAEQVTPERLLWNYIGSSEEERELIRPMLEEKIGVRKDTQFAMLLIHPDSMANELKAELENQMEILCIENYYMLVRPGEQGGIYIVLVDTERNQTLKRIFEMRILPKIQNITPCVATMDRFVGIWQLPDVMNELSALLEHTFCSGHEVIMTEKMAQMMEYEKLDYPTALENEMVQGIRSGKKDKLAEVGKIFSEQVILSRATPECIRNYTLRFLMGIARVEGEIRGDANQEEELRYMLESIRSSHTQKELQYQFQKVVKQAMAWNEETEESITENGIVLNAIAYIREHYMEAIGLQDVAQCCNVSPEYLSRIFKEETGVKFVDFLANFRISVGKRMLATGNYKVSEVAEAVGFNDQKYFQKVFKKICGISPAEYKKENSR
mgnify:CR=1 FL=1